MKPAHQSILRFALVAFSCLLVFNRQANAQMDSNGSPLIHDHVAGNFWLDGQAPDVTWPKNLADARQHDKLVLWGSWCTDPTGTGSLILGEFKAPAHFYMAVCGNPLTDGNMLKLWHPSDASELIITHDTPGNAWKQVEIHVPSRWVGTNIQICAYDNSTKPDGWFGLSEPYTLATDGTIQPLWQNRTQGLRLHFWFFNIIAPSCLIFLLYGLIGLSGFSILRRYLQTPPYLSPLLMTAVVGLLGYIAFWAFWIHRNVGSVTVWTIILLAGIYFVWCILSSKRSLLPKADWLELKWPVVLLIIAAMFNLAVLYFPRVEAIPMEGLASRRPTTWGLPSDNVLQQQLSQVLFIGGDPRILTNSEWSTSDRPPLQAGVQLLSGVLLCRTLKVEWNISAQLSGMILQLSWVYGVWALLRALGCSQKAAAQIVLCLMATPFLYTNTVFVWAKLSAAAFALGMTAILCLRGSRPLTVAEAATAGVLLSLGMLCHSGIFFYVFPILGFWFVLPHSAGRAGWRPIFVMGFTAGLMFLPWSCYQKFFDPPGNHLMKLSFAGVVDSNSRSTLQTVRSAYQALSRQRIIDNKIANFRQLVTGDWNSFFQLFPVDKPQRRLNGFFFLFRSLGVFLLGAAALPVLLLPAHRNKLRPFVFLLGAIAMALFIWCLAMFAPGATVVHAGAYGVPLVLLALLAYLLRLVHPFVLLVVGVYNLIQFLWVYLWTFPYPPARDPMAVMLLVTSLALATYVWVASTEVPAQST